MLFPRVVTLFLMMPLAGWLYNRMDPRILVAFGVVVIVWSSQKLSALTLTVGFWNLVPMLLLMGAGMPFMFVTVSTVSLNTMRRVDMTDASSLFTLARRVGGNIGYALVATVVERRTAFHRLHLLSGVNNFNNSFLQFKSGVSAYLGATPGIQQIQEKALKLTNISVVRQARMLAYNDASWIMGLLFLVVLPLVLLLPGQKRIKADQARMAMEGS